MSTRQNPPSTDDSQIHKSWLFTQNPDGTLSPADLSKSNIFVNGALPSLTNPLPVELSDGTQAFGTPSNPVGVNLAKVGNAAVSLGAKTSANSIPVVLASDEATLPVSLPSTTVTNTVAENLTQVGGSAVTLGAKTSAASIPVVLASDEANVPTLGAISAIVSTTITSATSTGTVLSIPCAGYSTVLVDIRALNSCTGGTIQFEGVGPGAFNSSVTGMRQIDSNSQQFYDATSSQSLALSNDTRIIYQIPVAGLSTVNVILSPAFTGSGSILLAGRASNGSAPGPTTVGQSDASKLNATTLGAVKPAAATTTWNSSSSPTVVVPCTGYGTVIANILVDAGTFSSGGLS